MPQLPLGVPLLAVQLAGYQLIIEVVKNRWRELNQEQRNAVTQLAFQQFSGLVSSGAAPGTAADAAAGSGGGAETASWPVRGKVSELLAVVVRQQGSGAYAELLPRLVGAAVGATGHPAAAQAAEVVCKVLHIISEDLTQFEVSANATEGAGVEAAAASAAAADAASPSSAGSAESTSKRAFLSALTASVPTVFPFLCEVLQRQFQMAQQLQQQQGAGTSAAGAAGLPAAMAAISAALGALSTWVEWTPMPRLTASPVIEACTFFLRAATPELRLQALDVLRQIVWRRRGNETPADYNALFDKLGACLLGTTNAIGMIVGWQDPLPPALVKELGWEGSEAEFGARLWEVLSGLGEGHFRCLKEDPSAGSVAGSGGAVVSACRRSLFLAQALTFTRHPYLRLSAATLPLWGSLLREATAQHPMAALMQQQGGKGDKNGHYTVPPDCCAALIRVLCQQMALVVPSADQGVDKYPPWADSHQEYKELISSYRGQTKSIIKMATQLAPQQGMEAAAAYLVTSLRACADADAAGPAAAAAARVSASGAAAPGAAPGEAVRQQAVLLEAAVAVLGSVLGPLCDLAAAGLASGSAGGEAAARAIVEGLVALLQSVLAVRLREPRLMALHAASIEAFGRLLQLRPDVAAPITGTCLQTMMVLPLEAPGQQPPPARQTPEWRAAFEARMEMANALVALAKAAPAAFVPHLPALVQEVQSLWERGLIREGERVLLWEGLLAASCAADPALQGEMLRVILQPIAQAWGAPEWRATVESPQAFVASYLPLTEVPSTGQQQQQQQAAAAQALLEQQRRISAGAGPGPSSVAAETAAAAAAAAAASERYELGARPQRWALYHQVTLLERAIRRTVPMPPPAAGPGPPAAPLSPGGGAGRPTSPPLGSLAAAAAGLPPHPLSAHLDWCLPPVARMVACVHGLPDPRVAAGLGPLAIVNQMDPLERAMRLGEDRDVVKAERTELRCVAGASLDDARYFVRGIRECSYMIMNLVAQHCGPALWPNAQLAAQLPAAVAGGPCGLSVLGPSQLRLVERHILTPWALRVPPGLAQQWLVPLCSAFLPHMQQRLTGAWNALLHTGGSGPDGPALTVASALNAPGASGPGRPATDAANDEVVAETLLRELTREHLTFLNTLLMRKLPDGSEAPTASGSAAAAAARVSANGAAGAAPSSPTAGRAAGAAAAAQPQECVLELLLRCDAQAAQGALAVGVTALCWPDADAAGKAVAFCRALAALAQAGHAELEGVVVSDVVRCAVTSLGNVSTIVVQTQVLDLVRSILATYLPPTQRQSAALRALLSSLPGVTLEVLDRFVAAFTAAHGEKDQRAVIKQLLAAVGGDEMRKLLTAVSRVPGHGVSAVPEPRAKIRGQISDVTPQDMGMPHLFDLPDVL